MTFVSPNNVMVIGLGGTGKLICTYLKKSLLEAVKDYQARSTANAYYRSDFGRDLPAGIKICCFDTDTTINPVIDLNFQLDNNPVTGEIISVYNKSLPEIKDRIVASRKADPRIGPWFEADDASQLEMPLSSIDRKGAGMQRQYSRASFLLSLSDPDNDRKFHTKILRDAIVEFRQRLDDPEYHNIRTYFFVVGSVAGGVGAGVFLDVGQIIRYYAKNLPNSELVGIFVLSKAFVKDLEGETDINTRQVEANTFAAMRELRRFMLLRGKGYRFDEFQGIREAEFDPRRLTDAQAPFQTCFFVDGTRNNGEPNNESSKFTVCPAIADFIQVYCLDQPPIIADYNNLYQASLEVKRPFATMGIHSFIYPVEDVVADFSHRLGIELHKQLLLPMPSHRDLKPDLLEIFKESDRFYGQHQPPQEFIIGTPDQDNRLILLDEVLTVVEASKGGAAGKPFDIEQFLTILRLPKRFVNDRVIKLEDHSLPMVNIDSAGVEISDHLEDNDVIQNHLRLFNTEPDEITKQAKKLIEDNIGSKNDQPYDSSKVGLKKTYHSILKYYAEKIGEIYGGYTDNAGNYYAGIFENKLMVLLNEKVGERPKLDASGNPCLGRLSQQPVQEAIYRYRNSPIETAINFCTLILTYFKHYENIRKAAFDDRFKLDPVAQTSLLKTVEEELESTKSDFKGSSVPRLKSRSYLQKKQELLQVKRWMLMHGYCEEILKNLVSITENWKKTLEDLKERVEKVKQSLEESYQALVNVRNEKRLIKVRTYISQPGSAAEEDLYEQLMNKEVRKDDGQAVSRRESFLRTVWLDFGADAIHVGGTGRQGLVKFIYNDFEPDIYSKEDALLNAAPFCDGVRYENFWNLLQSYRDKSGRLRYQPGQGENTSSQLVLELKNKTQELAQYEENPIFEKVLAGGQETASRNYGCYAPWITRMDDKDKIGLYSEGLKDKVDDFLVNCFPSAENQGQAHKIVGIRMTHILAHESFTEYPEIAQTYRERLAAIHNPDERARPVHLFLGEKHAAKWEEQVMARRQELGIPLAHGEQFFLPLELTFALDNPDALDDFLWAGVFSKIVLRADNLADDNYAITLQNYNCFLTEGKNPPRLLDALTSFTSRRDHEHETMRQEIKTLIAIERKNRKKNRVEYASYLKSILTVSEGPINHFVSVEGSGFKTIVAAGNRQHAITQFAAEEYLEIMLKLHLIREIEAVST